jgi:hypothetical protein
MKEMYDSIGYKIQQKLYCRDTFFFILERNHNELQDLMKKCLEDPFLLKVKFSGNQQEQYTQRRLSIDLLLREVNRLIFNFISSAFSLLEFNKSFLSEHKYLSYTKSDLDNFYREPIAGFIFGLRNHFLHGNLISFQQSYGERIAENGEHEISENGYFFQLEEIEKYLDGKGDPRWTKNAEAIGKSYIELNKPKICAMKTCREYYEKIHHIHQSINKSLSDKYAVELAELRKMQI